MLWRGGELNGEGIDLLHWYWTSLFPFCSIRLFTETKQKPRQGVHSCPCSHRGAAGPSADAWAQKGINEPCLREAAGLGFRLHRLHTRDCEIPVSSEAFGACCTARTGADADTGSLAWLELCAHLQGQEQPHGMAIITVRTKEGKAYWQSLGQKDPLAAVVWQFRAAMCMTSTQLSTPDVSVPVSSKWHKLCQQKISFSMHQIIQHLKDSLKSFDALRLLHREISQVVRADVLLLASSQFHPSLKQRDALRYFLSCNP